MKIQSNISLNIGNNLYHNAENNIRDNIWLDIGGNLYHNTKIKIGDNIEWNIWDSIDDNTPTTPISPQTKSVISKSIYKQI